MLKLLKLPPPPLVLAFLAYLNRSGSISCSCVDLVALLLSGLEQGVGHAAGRGMTLLDEHLALFSRNISTINHLTAASSDRPTTHNSSWLHVFVLGDTFPGRKFLHGAGRWRRIGLVHILLEARPHRAVPTDPGRGGRKPLIRVHKHSPRPAKSAD